MCAVVVAVAAAVDEVDAIAVKESFVAEDLVLMLDDSDMIKRRGGGMASLCRTRVELGERRERSGGAVSG